MQPIVQELAALTPETIAAVLRDHSFAEHRNVARVPADGAASYLRASVAAAAERAGTTRLVALDPDGRPAGLCLLQRVAADSDLLGIEVAGVPALCVRADHPAPRAVHAALAARLAEVAVRERFRHVSARTDTADLAAYQALSDAGFRLMETLVTLTHDARRRTGAANGLAGYRVRRATPADVPALRSLAARRFRQNRYHRDEDLPRERVDALMARWIESYVEDAADHEVWIAETADGRLAGFLGHALNRELERHAGVLVSGRALLAVEDPRTGVGGLLARTHVERSRGELHEADTQLDNFGMIKVAFQLGMDLTRTRYTFHRTF
jgi:hypothetical protein